MEVRGREDTPTPRRACCDLLGGSVSGGGGRYPRPVRSVLRNVSWPWRPRPAPLPDLLDDGTLQVVGGSFDPAASDAGVVVAMEARGADLSRAHLVRHHLALPDAAAVEQAGILVAQEGYAVVGEPLAPGGWWQVRASRTELLDGRVLAQERSRMAGLAQRLGGTAEGWDACAPSGHCSG